jgi:hypothetical protein
VLVGDSKDTPKKEVLFDLHTSRSCQRATIRQQKTEREHILAVDLDSDTFTFAPSDCVMESIRDKLDPNVRINVADQNRHDQVIS